MARIDWVEQRLQNWARYVLTSGGSGNMGYAGVDWSGMANSNAGRDGYITTTIPIAECEAGETAASVMTLPSELRATVEAFYLGNGGVRQKCERLCISEDTLYRRIDRAHRALAQLWDAKRQAQQAERERLEQLLESARPRGFYAAG